MIRRGDIHYISASSREVGSEQVAGRPAIVVSTDKCNEHSTVVEVVFLTTRPKTELPTHVRINSTARPSVALCEQISSVSVARVKKRVGACTIQELDAINNALRISLSLNSINKNCDIGE